MAAATATAQVTKRRKKSRGLDTFQRIFATPTAKLGGILFVIILVLCVFAPLFTKYQPGEMDMTATLQGPSAAHWFGTDNLGRDQWTRILYGGRYSLALGIIGSLFAAVGGTGLGIVAGYFGGQVEKIGRAHV